MLACGAPARHAAPARLSASTAGRDAARALRAPPPPRCHAARVATPRASLDTATLAVSSVAGAGVPVGIYAALGATAASFCGTFFVAPAFKNQFKEAEPWERIYAELLARGVPAIAPADAARKRGAVLLDVRLPDAARARALPRALPVPLYVPIRNFDVFSNIRRVAFAFFGIAGTELNPEFLAAVAAAVPNKNAEVVVLCEMGGKLENRPGMKFGFQSRSLKALYYLRQAGYRNVKHMTGGVAQWAADGLPLIDGQE